MNAKSIWARRVTETVELVVEIPDDELVLRVDILEEVSNPGSFTARIWRLEPFRLQSTFPQVNGIPSHPPSDEFILKEFEGLESPLETARQFASAQEASTFVIERVAAWASELT